MFNNRETAFFAHGLLFEAAVVVKDILVGGFLFRHGSNPSSVSV